MDDQEIIGLMDCFRNRLRKLITVEPLMDLLHFLEDDDKELIRVQLNTKGNLCAVDQLLDTITKRVRPLGWFKEFVDALEAVGCTHAVGYIINSPPHPSLEAENDNCIKLIHLLQFSLVRMKTRDVCVSCYTLDILTEEDCDNIFAEIENKGNISAARLLLRRVARNKAGWFSTFLRALQKTGHPDLVKELLGEDLDAQFMEGDQPCGETDAQKPPQDPEPEDAQSEGSLSLPALALWSSTQAAAGLLYDYTDDEIDIYTDPCEVAEQANVYENKDICSPDVPVKDQSTSPPVGGSVLPPKESHGVQADDTHSVDNPLAVLPYRILTQSKSPSSLPPAAAFPGLPGGGGPEGGVCGAYGWDDDYELADGNILDDWDDDSAGDGGLYWSDSEDAGADMGPMYDSDDYY